MSTAMRVLVSGFEPFGGESVNPSGEVVRALQAAPPADVELATIVLPVVQGAAEDVLLPAIDRLRPDAWIGLGEAGGRAKMCVERIGINVVRAEEIEEQPVVSGAGAAAYFATLPLHEMVDAMHRAGVPAMVSNTAGTYICNLVLFSVLHSLERGAPSPAGGAGFIHLPYLPEQVAAKPALVPSLPLDAQVAGVRAAMTLLAADERAAGASAAGVPAPAATVPAAGERSG